MAGDGHKKEGFSSLKNLCFLKLIHILIDYTAHLSKERSRATELTDDIIKTMYLLRAPLSANGDLFGCFAEISTLSSSVSVCPTSGWLVIPMRVQ